MLASPSFSASPAAIRWLFSGIMFLIVCATMATLAAAARPKAAAARGLPSRRPQAVVAAAAVPSAITLI